MDIRGFEDYQIYPDGRLWSKKRNKFLKACKSEKGYMHLRLFKDGKPYCKKIHRLIAEQYISNPENKKEVDHINRVRDDNRLENLRWVTHQENLLNINTYKTNNSGHKNISYDTGNKNWRFKKNYFKKQKVRVFQTKTEALCFKYIQLLKIKAGNF